MNLQVATDKKQAAIFLMCIGTDAHNVFKSFKLSDAHRKRLTSIIVAFKGYCIGTVVNVTYEQYLLNMWLQDSN
jgi:hypothetical protein